MKKPVIRSFNFVRAISTIGIVVYHLSCHLSDRSFLPLYTNANVDWGCTLVTVFFLLSGASLSYQYAGEGITRRASLRSYYYKRWKSIFPMYYLAYGVIEVLRIIAHRNLFFRGNPVHYLWTFLGMDGYLSEVIITFYTLGEWFTGAIFILYLLFPFLLYSMERRPLLTGLSIFLLYFFTLDVPIINPHSYWSIPSCLFSFACGMLLMRLRSIFQSRFCAALCAFGLLILCVVKLPFLSPNISDHLAGVLLFVLLDAVGRILMTKPLTGPLFTRLSSVSYAVFLLHHVVLLKLLSYWQPVGPLQVMSFLLGALLLILLLSALLTRVTRVVMKHIEPMLLRKLSKLHPTPQN